MTDTAEWYRTKYAPHKNLAVGKWGVGDGGQRQDGSDRLLVNASAGVKAIQHFFFFFLLTLYFFRFKMLKTVEQSPGLM